MTIIRAAQRFVSKHADALLPGGRQERLQNSNESLGKLSAMYRLPNHSIKCAVAINISNRFASLIHGDPMKDPYLFHYSSLDRMFGLLGDQVMSKLRVHYHSMSHFEIEMKSGIKVFFDRDGTLHEVHLSKNYVIQGVKFTAGTRISFDQKGRVIAAMLGNDQFVQNILFKAGTTLLFNDNFKVMMATFEQPQEVNGIKCSPGTSAVFYPDGKLMRARLSEPQEIQGIQFNKGDWVHFDPNGKFTHAECSNGTIIGNIPQS